MANVRVRPETGHLYIEFRYLNKRCREQTALADTPANRRVVNALAARVTREITRGSFDYAVFFPDSPRARNVLVAVKTNAAITPEPVAIVQSTTPEFAAFADVWFTESSPRWRKQYRLALRTTIDRIFVPFFAGKPLAQIDRALLLAFQAHIAQRKGRRGQSLSAKRINKLMSQLQAILEEGCQRHGLNNPAKGIKRLKQKRSDVQPFTLEDFDRLVTAIRPDFKCYLIVRMLTGLRTGEANGLQWDDIDFTANTLRVERTISRDGDGETKTEDSRRTIPLAAPVRQALLAHREVRNGTCPWIFHVRNGQPINAVNFTNRVWYPLLRHVGLKLRPPYQMRHTAATLMLAAGENPEWVAAMLGHSTTEMLFRVYSRFVPNLTRNDGRAFAGLLNSRSGTSAAAPLHAEPPDLSKLTRAQLEAMVRTLGSAQPQSSKEDTHVA